MKNKNVVFILADDMGAWSLGSAGNTEIITPNLDKMANGGMRFENFFCTSPVCSPARASILTGLLPSCHGVHDWIRSGNIKKSVADKIKNVDGRYECESETAIDYLSEFDTYTKKFADNGYNCALSGKWHLGDSITPKQGFTKWYTIGMGGCLYMKPDMVENGKIEIKEEYVTHLITDKAITYLDELSKDNKPFYLSVHYTAPHSPWDSSNHPKEYLDLYKNCPCNSCPKEKLSELQVNSSPYATNEDERREHIRGYYASITAMDKGIGKILDKLEDLGVAEDTLIIFTSDNGVSMGHHGTWGKGNSTIPLNLFDTNVKVPFIAYQKGNTPKVNVPQGLYSHYDIYSTLLEYADIEYEKNELSPGRSFYNLINGDVEDSKRNSVYVIDEYGPVRMVRDQEYKYVHRYPYGPDELYNIKIDKEEKNNIIVDSKERKNSNKAKEIIQNMDKNLSDKFLKYSTPQMDALKYPIYGKGQMKKIDGVIYKTFKDDFFYVNKNKKENK